MNVWEFLNLTVEERQNLEILALDLSRAQFQDDDEEVAAAVAREAFEGLFDDGNQIEFRVFCQKLSQCQKLHSLDLSENDLCGEFSSNQFEQLGNALAQCENLSSLNLSDNFYADSYHSSDGRKISALIRLSAQCPNLQKLDFSNNRLFRLSHDEEFATANESAQADFRVFCQTLAQCQKLRSLDLSKNVLADLSIDQLGQLGNALAQCEYLSSLNLSDNLYTDSEPDSVPDRRRTNTLIGVFAQCPNLQKLGFSHNGLFGLRDYCESSSESSSESSEEVSVTAVESAQADFRVFCQTLAQCQKLRSLDLSKNVLCVLSMDQLGQLGNALAQCDYLSSLNLSGCFYNNDYIIPDESGDGRKAIALIGIFAQCPNLQKLDFSNNRLFEQFSAFFFTALRNAFRNCPKLASLNLSSSNLSFCIIPINAFAELFKTLTACTKLTSLDFSNTSFIESFDTTNVFKEISETMKKCFEQYNNLRILNLSGNDLLELNTSSIKDLCVWLSGCRNLNTLDLSSNLPCIEDYEDFKLHETLATELLRCRALQFLNLSHNFIDKLIPNRVHYLTCIFARHPELVKIIGLEEHPFSKMYLCGELSKKKRRFYDKQISAAQCFSWPREGSTEELPVVKAAKLPREIQARILSFAFPATQTTKILEIMDSITTVYEDKNDNAHGAKRRRM